MEVTRDAVIIRTYGAKTSFESFLIIALYYKEYFLITRNRKGRLISVFLKQHDFFQLCDQVKAKKELNLRNLSVKFIDNEGHQETEICFKQKRFKFRVTTERLFNALIDLGEPPRLPAELIASLVAQKTKQKKKR